MATFEAIGSGTTGAKNYTLKLEINETSYSIANNTSTVSWALYLTSKNNYSFSSWSFPVTVNVDGEVYNSSEYRSMSANSTLLIANGTKTIEHNSDGTKTINCSASLSATAATYLPRKYKRFRNIKINGYSTLCKFYRALYFINRIKQYYSKMECRCFY